MLGTQNLPLFIASGLLLNLMPGPDTLYLAGRSSSQGRKAGVVSVLGISSGCAVHTVAAAFGLSAILAATASAFTVVRLAGAAYLVYLGLRLLLDRTVAATTTGELPTQKLLTIYRQGVMTNVFNPKVASLSTLRTISRGLANLVPALALGSLLTLPIGQQSLDLHSSTQATEQPLVVVFADRLR